MILSPSEAYSARVLGRDEETWVPGPNLSSNLGEALFLSFCSLSSLILALDLFFFSFLLEVSAGLKGNHEEQT